MSYSFSVTASTKDEAKQKIAEQFALVVKNQPNHALDEAAAVAAGAAFIDMLGDVSEGHEIGVSMHGSVGWSQDAHDAPPRYVSSGVGISVGIRQKVAANG